MYSSKWELMQLLSKHFFTDSENSFSWAVWGSDIVLLSAHMETFFWENPQRFSIKSYMKFFYLHHLSEDTEEQGSKKTVSGPMTDPWSEWAAQVEGGFSQSWESPICSNYQKHFLTKQGTACMRLRIPVLSTKQAAVERSASQFICHQRKVLFASLLGFWIRSRSKRGIFLFDLLPNHSSAGAMGMRNSLKILTRYVLFGEDTHRPDVLQPMPPVPAKGQLWSRLWRGKGQQPKSTSHRSQW